MPVSIDPLGYTVHCKHCEASPVTEGPHHNKRCPRYRPTLSTTSELATKYKCRFCGVRPFAAGHHHKKSCKRHLPV